MKAMFRVCALLLLAGSIAGAQGDYVIGAQDVLTVTVYDHQDLTGKFTVEADGTLTFPLIGRVKAGGLTLRGFEEELQKRLADGYLRNPQVSVAVGEYRSQQIFVMGEVRSAGAYLLSGEMTVMEALAKAGGTLPTAADEILIVRPQPGAGQAGPTMPEPGKDATVLRVNVRELQAGAMSQNAVLKDGDTIIAPRARGVYVFGQVKSPGAYPIEQGTTVLQALSLAGGVTDRGSTGRIKIVRTIDGKKKEIKVKLTDLVEPDDTLIVAERFF